MAAVAAPPPQHSVADPAAAAHPMGPPQGHASREAVGHRQQASSGPQARTYPAAGHSAATGSGRPASGRTASRAQSHDGGVRGVPPAGGGGAASEAAVEAVGSFDRSRSAAHRELAAAAVAERRAAAAAEQLQRQAEEEAERLEQQQVSLSLAEGFSSWCVTVCVLITRTLVVG